MKHRRPLIAVKVGSNVLTRSDGSLDITRMSALVDQIAELRRNKLDVILISSGAVASGRSELRELPHGHMDHVDQRQLYSAVGQAKLINRYYELFREHGITVGQVLTMKESFSTRRHCLNQRNCMSVMLANGVLPIVNENDTVSVTELMFTDNDELSGLIATLMGARTLIILSNVDGIYNGKPGTPGASVIRDITRETDLSRCISSEKSGFGRGGMVTKSNIALRVAEAGIEVLIANGKRDNVLCDLLFRPESLSFTRFLPHSEGGSDAGGLKSSPGISYSKGRIFVTAATAETLRAESAADLPLSGITRIEGIFEPDDLVRLIAPDGCELGIGRSSLGSEEARRRVGRHDAGTLVPASNLYIE